MMIWATAKEMSDVFTFSLKVSHLNTCDDDDYDDYDEYDEYDDYDDHDGDDDLSDHLQPQSVPLEHSCHRGRCYGRHSCKLSSVITL